ncbi:MAG: CPBP family intramembrane metalloprotease [Brevundimonas sp.]|uniref:CPBP family intramembrane glutamic endopeptidase n=1 Tax=Brevundimonas sp. TaxID=1871086 RepID=UPI0025C60689|nr:CPBP family intramembrane glutamic endopeptidase [Brevundimonas sp.]MBX3478473.1 CPBP family intramembrane metalloprotease [Brevundimonas sp.]
MTVQTDQIGSPQRSPKWAVLLEVAAFVVFALLSKFLLSLLFWRYAGPVSLLLTLVVLTAYLRFRGPGWKMFGLVPLPGWKARLMVIPQAALALVAFAIVVALTTVIGPSMGLDFLTEVPSEVDDRWGEVAGSLPHYLMWLAIVWTAAAFGEEMFFRGYLISRLREVFPGHRLGAIPAVIIPALIFGYGHFYYQGLRGAVVTGAIGLAFGTMFLLFKRNLWPLILLHGLIDTLTFTAIFMRWD